MRVRVFSGMVGDSAAAFTWQVKEGQSIVFLTPSAISGERVIRFYDQYEEVHQVPIDRVISIDPDAPEIHLPVRYLDAETGKEVTHRER